MKHLLFSFIILLSLEIKGNSSDKKLDKNQEELKIEQFKPHMLDHPFEGCPANSGCTEKLGLLNKKWSELLKKSIKGKNLSKKLISFTKTNGVPIPLWLTEDASTKDNLIIWDSPCKNHNLENQKSIKMGMIFTKSLNDLSSLIKEKKVLPRFLNVYQGENKKPIELQTIRGETPLYFNGSKIIYQLGSEGLYYGLGLNPKGKLKIVTPVTPQEFPSSTPCPKSMEDSLKKKTIATNLYSGFYCQKIWNIKTKKFEIIQIGWSCN